MKKPLFLSSSLLGGLIVCLAAAPALAQDATQPPPSSAPMSAPPSGGSMGSSAIGIGAEAFLSAVNGAPVAGGEFVYDTSMFHVEALLGYNHTSPANNGASSSLFQFGVAGWYHLARGSNADFSIGGGVGLVYNSPAVGGSSTGFVIEPGAEARYFFSPNFAVNGRVGIAITTGDGTQPTTLSIGGQETAGFGFTYFFR